MVWSVLALLAQSPVWMDSQHVYGTVFLADPKDTERKKRTLNDPDWLSAVGRLSMGDQERHCSASLLASPTTPEEADTIVTAAHCVNGVSVATLNVTFLSKMQRPVHREIASIDAQGDLPWGDWAVLTLKRPISARDVHSLPWKVSATFEPVYHVLAGYSGDHTTQLGNAGRDLTYDQSCVLSKEQPYLQWIRLEGCYTYPGASGGAYVKVDAQGQAVWQGSLSSIRPGINYVVPSSTLQPVLSQQ